MSQTNLCAAIKVQCLVRFYYSLDVNQVIREFVARQEFEQPHLQVLSNHSNRARVVALAGCFACSR